MSKERSLANLQQALSMELTAMHQYQLHGGVLDDWGLSLLADKMREEMAEETGHSTEFMNRVLFLKGAPELKFAKQPVLAKSLQEMFELDLADEREAIDFYTQASLQAAEDADLGTRALFEKIALGEEEHMAWLELQLDLLRRIGEPAYISKHMSDPGE